MELEGKKIGALTEATSLADTDVFVMETAAPVTKKTKWITIYNTIKEKIKGFTFDGLKTEDKTLPGAVNELNVLAKGMDKRVKELETAESGPTGTGQGNDQGIYKDPSGILVIFGSAQSLNFADDSVSGVKKMEITFRESFKTTPVVVAGSSYRSGVPERTGVLDRETTGCILGCSSAVDGLHVQWIAIGTWK